MMLSQPDRVIAAAVHDLDALQSAGKNRWQRNSALRPTEELQDSKFHFFTDDFDRTSQTRLLASAAAASASGRRRRFVVAPTPARLVRLAARDNDSQPKFFSSNGHAPAGSLR